MNGVLGFIDLLQRSELSTEQRRQAELIAQSGNTMMLLLNDILDISKIEAGHLTIAKQPVEIRNLLNDCIALQNANAIAKGISLETNFAEAGPVCISADPLRLRQIVLNLLGNALKFTDKGVVRLKLVVDEAKDTVAISVEDTGIGISADRMDHIFSAFEQAASNTSRRYGGTGLGLTISRQLAELQGGTLAGNSMPGMGSCFTLTMTLGDVETDCAETPAIIEHEPVTMLPSARILLAEDHDINQLLMTAMLEQCGQSVTIAQDGNEAIRLVKEGANTGRPYDLVLMDVQMPHCDGYCATRAIRDAGIDAAALPIVAVTANAYADDIGEALSSGMQAHLTKPLMFNDLVTTLKRWLPQNADPSRVSNTRPVAAAPAKAPDEAAGQSKLDALWTVRRREALELIATAMRNGALTGDGLPEIASAAHKLAGTASMFGEAELGERARALETALRSPGPEKECEELARKLLEAA